MLDDKAQLEKGMQILGFENIPQIISKLLIYKELLIKWNNSFNLTSVKNKEIVTKKIATKYLRKKMNFKILEFIL